MINLTRAALPVLHRQRADHIIQFSSIGGREGSPALGAYQLSKFAVGGFSEAGRRGSAARHQGRHHQAGRLPDRLGRPSMRAPDAPATPTTGRPSGR